jgi:hypothetical protein
MVVRCLNFAAKIVFFFETCKLFGLYSENSFDFLDYIPKFCLKIRISTIKKDFYGLVVAFRILSSCPRARRPLRDHCSLSRTYLYHSDGFQFSCYFSIDYCSICCNTCSATAFEPIIPQCVLFAQ